MQHEDSPRYWDAKQMVWRIKPTHFIEVYNNTKVIQKNHKQFTGPMFGISLLDGILKSTKDSEHLQTVVIWRIREKTPNSLVSSTCPVSER
jgi:hypothetical protein